MENVWKNTGKTHETWENSQMFRKFWGKTLYFGKFEPGATRSMAIEVETGCLALKGDSIGALVTLPSLPTSATNIYIYLYGPYVASRFWILISLIYH